MTDDPPAAAGPSRPEAPENAAGSAARGAPSDPRAERPLRLEQIAERRWGVFRVRYPLGAEVAAERAAEMLTTLGPVVERYLGAPLEGDVRLDLLERARASGVNPAVGVIRHALRGFEQRSPRTAGVMSYQLGRIGWYRATGEGRYRGTPPREPDWLLEAALLPLLHIWSERERWLDYVAEQVDRFAWRKPLDEAELVQQRGLEPRRKALALAQSLLRGQSLVRRRPDWVRELVAAFAADPQLTAAAALEQISGVDAAGWQSCFAADLAAWREASTDPALGAWQTDGATLVADPDAS